MKELTSKEYMYHCINILQSDKTTSDAVIILMFLEYKKRVLKENKSGA